MKFEDAELDTILGAVEGYNSLTIDSQVLAFVASVIPDLITDLKEARAKNRELKAEAEIWKERVQMRQELVGQYERDIAELKRELRAALERS